MSWDTIFIFLHILTMFIAVALTVGSEQLLRRVAATENVAAIRTTFGAAVPLRRAIPMTTGSGSCWASSPRFWAVSICSRRGC